MLYADYARRKMHNVVKLDTKEGYPLTVYNCANKNLKDYSITGNTGGVGDKTENLFNYTEPYNDNQIKADEDGWFDVTINNKNGTSIYYQPCYTVVNKKLKTNTEYYVQYDEAECSGNPRVRVISFTGEVNAKMGQFTGSELIRASGYRTTLSSFDSCSTMLRTYVACGAGESCHVKFRIAVYEVQKDTFEPYDKYKIPVTVTGKNLFDYNYYFMNKAAFGGTSSNDSVSYKLKPNTQYIVSSNYPFSKGTSVSVFFVKTGKYSSSNIPTTVNDGVWEGNNRTVTTDDEGFLYIASRNSSSGLQVPTLQEFATGRYWISLEEGTSATSYEPYHEPITTNIYRDVPLADGESINYKADNLPNIVLNKGSNTITTDTAVKPKKISAKYYKK